MVDILDDDLLRHILWKLDAAGLRAAQQICVAWSRVARHMLESSEWQAAALTLTMLLSRHEASEQALEIALANSDEAALRRFFRYFKRNCMGRACVPTKLHGLMRKNPHLDVGRRESLDQMAQRAADLYYVGRHEEVALLQRKARATLRTIRQHNARSGLEASKHAASLEQLPNQGRSLAAPWSWSCKEGNELLGIDCDGGLWLNLSDGHIGSGSLHRVDEQGKGGAFAHYQETRRLHPPDGFPLVVKLGTVCKHGADVHSYADGKLVHDPLLAKHLLHWGIDMAQVQQSAHKLLYADSGTNGPCAEC